MTGVWGAPSMAWYRVFLNDQYKAPVFTRTHQWAALLVFAKGKNVNAIYSHMKSLREYKSGCEPEGGLL